MEKVYRLITLQLGTSLMVCGEGQDERRRARRSWSPRINRAEAAMRAEFPEIQWLFFEPDIAD